MAYAAANTLCHVTNSSDAIGQFLHCLRQIRTCSVSVLDLVLHKISWKQFSLRCICCMSKTLCGLHCIVCVHKAGSRALDEQFYSSLDWVMSHWAQFTVHRLIVCSCGFCCFFILHMCCIIVLLDLIRLKPNPQDPIFLQCFDNMTCNVFGGTLNLAQLQLQLSVCLSVPVCKVLCGSCGEWSV